MNSSLVRPSFKKSFQHTPFSWLPPALSGSLKKFEGLRSEVGARLSQEQIELAEARAKKYEELTSEPLVEPTPADAFADEPEPPAE